MRNSGILPIKKTRPQTAARWAATFLMAVAAVALILPAPVQAQDSYKTDLSYQIKGGLVSSFLSGNNYQDTGAGIGWTAGAALYLPLFTHALGVQFEGMYVAKKFDVTLTSRPLPEAFPDDVGANATNFEFDLDFVEVPVLGRLTFARSQNAYGYFLGGAAVGFNAKASMTYMNDQGGTSTVDLENVDTFDWSPIVGIGVISSKFLLEFRFGWGTNKQGDESSLDTKISTTTLLIGLAL